MSTVKETERERYQRYLCSPEWNWKRNAVIERACGKCEKCGRTARHVHHLTYIRKYNERLEDLQALCEQCHEAIHNPKQIDQEELAVRRECNNLLIEFFAQDPLTRFNGMFCIRRYAELAATLGVSDDYSKAVGDYREAARDGDTTETLMAKRDVIRLHRLMDGLEGFVAEKRFGH
jgi:hypothetical protein